MKTLIEIVGIFGDYGTKFTSYQSFA